jgi:hypothetical protein
MRGAAWRNIALGVALLAVPAVGEVSGNGAPSYEEAVSFLGGQGYPPGDYTLLFSWNERVGDPGKKVPVQGYRLRPADGRAPFDVYFRDGSKLGEREVRGLGLGPKKWDTPLADLPSAPAGRWRKAAVKAAPVVPRGIQYGVPPGDTIELPELDIKRLRGEDRRQQETPEKGALRMGVFQTFDQEVEVCAGDASQGQWTVLPDGGALWSIEVVAPGALGQRVQFITLELPAGGEVVVYGAGAPDLALGPFTGVAADDTELWVPTCFDERVVVECYVPASAAPGEVCLRMPRIAHIYKSVLAAALEKAGSCNIDVTCQPAWADTALGIGGLGVVSSPNVLFCTCTLLADLDDCTEIPYVLTANHCVGGQTGPGGASNLEFYWFFQTAACNGAPPSLASVPRTTGGADYLAGMGGTGYVGGGNDFTLLRMRQLPPAHVTPVGWTSAAPPVGTNVTVIHHPRGEYKRISFGHSIGVGNAYPDLYHQILWDQGTTEPGSSGSALMISATHQIIGQLWGGRASCTLVNEPDYFGRFDVTYSVVQGYLNPPMVGIETVAYTVGESEGTVHIPVRLTSPARDQGGTIEVRVTVGTAQPDDFSLVSDDVVFVPGQEEGLVTVSIVADSKTESDETFTLTIENPSCITVDAAARTVTVTILDDDSDADGDGLSDHDEIHGTYGYTSDPALADTDGDGLSDYAEVMGTNGYQTDPSDPDTDGDGIMDYLEILHGLNPLDPDDRHEMSSFVIPWFRDVEGKPRAAVW